jgi:predicted ATPase
MGSLGEPEWLEELRALLEQGADRSRLFAAFLDVLQAKTAAPSPMLVVIEDVHWADNATLDLIKFLGRRIERTAALLLLTYRDDALDREHPLWLVLGDLPRPQRDAAPCATAF